jgi:FAD/FMN-containing dehydrogenase
MDTFRTAPIEQLKELHLDPPGPVPASGNGMLLEDFTAEAIDGMTRTSVGSSLLSVEVRHLGAALAEARAGNGALAKIPAAYSLYAVGMAPTPEAKARVDTDVARLHQALAQWDAGHRNGNFTGKKVAPQALWEPEAFARLRQVKATWDPDNVFRSNHELTPAEAHAPAGTLRRAPRPIIAPSRIAPQQP